jgi:Uma2 family endonuclease
LSATDFEELIMSTATLALHLGPADRGRELTYEEYLASNYEEGYKYELIEGRLYVSPLPDYPHARIEKYVHEALVFYKLRRPGVIQEVFTKARVFVRGVKRTTCPEPDVSVYKVCPPDNKNWEDISPIIVVEVVSGDPDKDYVRNVDLYHRVPSIREYWLFDRCEEEDGPTLRVYHRGTVRQKWKIADYGPDDVYSTALLPGLKLPVRPPN